MTIRTGIGGWVYPPWRGGTFYPPRLVQKQELAFASRAVAAIEINATFRSLQKPDSFARWRDETPDGFVFALKGSRYVTNRKVLAEAGEAVGRFMGQGIAELGDRLGPICWQLATTKTFDADDMASFLALLPREQAGLPLRHAIEVGHDSFACAAFIDMARAAEVAVVWSQHPDRVRIGDRTAGFAYLRCQDMQPEEPAGYTPEALDRLAGMCRAWADGDVPPGLPMVGASDDKPAAGGDVFAFLINGAKERAPAAAMALAERVKGTK
ncbi:DUF72 domain-containing protein [Croceibacterium ferulae]|uniref:DUF72 domain-containing protein n=1 Tax=Croceibacterium ferulae TaxID=1854641 RepID=UPI000EAEF650|nr:DUF72 domain-containing protein [Croceibacterium ferulae]